MVETIPKRNPTSNKLYVLIAAWDVVLVGHTVMQQFIG